LNENERSKSNKSQSNNLIEEPKKLKSQRGLSAVPKGEKRVLKTNINIASD